MCKQWIKWCWSPTPATSSPTSNILTWLNVRGTSTDWIVDQTMPDNKGASGCGYLSVWNVWLFVSPKPIDVVTDKSISFTRADMFHKDRSLDQRTALSAPGCSVQDKLQVAQLSWPPPHPFWEGKRGGLNKGPLIVSARDIVTRIAFSSPRYKWPSFHPDQRTTVVSAF